MSILTSLIGSLKERMSQPAPAVQEHLRCIDRQTEAMQRAIDDAERELRKRNGGDRGRT